MRGVRGCKDAIETRQRGPAAARSGPPPSPPGRRAPGAQSRRAGRRCRRGAAARGAQWAQSAGRAARCTAGGQTSGWRSAPGAPGAKQWPAPVPGAGTLQARGWLNPLEASQLDVTRSQAPGWACNPPQGFAPAAPAPRERIVAHRRAQRLGFQRADAAAQARLAGPPNLVPGDEQRAADGRKQRWRRGGDASGQRAPGAAQALPAGLRAAGVPHDMALQWPPPPPRLALTRARLRHGWARAGPVGATEGPAPPPACRSSRCSAQARPGAPWGSDHGAPAASCWRVVPARPLLGCWRPGAQVQGRETLGPPARQKITLDWPRSRPRLAVTGTPCVPRPAVLTELQFGTPPNGPAPHSQGRPPAVPRPARPSPRCPAAELDDTGGSSSGDT